MTLHWWMHWFWVTAQFLVILGNPVPSSTSEPRGQIKDHLSPKLSPELNSERSSEIPSVEAEGVYRSSNPQRQTFRAAKAIGLYSQTNTAVILDRQVTTISAPMERANAAETASTTTSTTNDAVDRLYGNDSIVSIDPSRTSLPQRMVDNTEKMRNPLAKKDSKITWILASNKTARSKYEQENKIEGNASRVNVTDQVEDLTVLPLQEEVSRVRLVLNKTKPILSASSLSSSADSPEIRSFNRSDDELELDEELVEPQLFATAASILEVGVSDSPRLSRARSAFPKDFQRDQVQGDDHHLPDYNDSSSENSGKDNSSRSAGDIAAITGSCLATIVLLSTMGSLGFIMYRRRYLNPPQTLNSDKCSNPDSSGYIDDSTIRDNSEEMYSLDNDSFLNSLEAMTIQNYWTDSVKHTKL